MSPDASGFPEDAASTDEATDATQPGLRELREAVANAHRHLPRGQSLRHDGLAGLSLAVANVPDGMANGVLVGVNPLYGLYATMMGPLVGGLLSSTQLMVITTTAAASLTAGQSLAQTAASHRSEALFALVLLVGVFQLLLGVLGLGRMTRFVSYSVTTGFLAGISTLLIVSQYLPLPDTRRAAATRSCKRSTCSRILKRSTWRRSLRDCLHWYWRWCFLGPG